MIHYVQKRPPVQCIDLDGKPAGEAVSFDRAIAIATTTVLNAGVCDTLTLIDLRRRFQSAKVLDFVPVEDAPYAALLAEFKSGKTMGWSYAMAAEDHIKAWTEAPTEMPASVVAPEPTP